MPDALPEEIARAISERLATRHGREGVDLAREVSLPGSDPPEATVTYLPKTPQASARYLCTACPGLIFVVGDPDYADPERLAWLVRLHPELHASLLRGVTDPKERALLLEEWDRGGFGKAQVAEVRRRRAMRTRTADRPTVSARRGRCQRFLLDKVARGFTVEAAIDALVALSAEDLGAYQKATGSDRVLTRPTLRKYWQDLPLETRETARRAGAARRAGGEEPIP